MATTYQPSQWLIPKNTNTDKVGNYSFEFDGSADYIDMGNVLDKSIGDSFSISAWIKLSSIPLSFKLIVSKMDHDAPFNGYQISISDTNKLYMGLRGTAEIYSTSSTVFVADTWYHIAGTYDGSGVNTGINIYINGVLDNDTQSGTFTGTLSNSTDLQISGRDGANILFPGNISEVSVFNYALSAPNVTTLYGSAGAGVGNPMALDIVPVAYYKGDRAALGDQWAVPNQVSKDYVFDFDGSTDWVNCGSDSSLDLDDEITLSAWMKTGATDTTTTIGPILFKDGTVGGQRSYGLCFRPLSAGYDKALVYIFHTNGNSTSLYTSTAGALSDGNWHHVMATYDGTDGTDALKIYVDGVLDNTATPTSGDTGIFVYAATNFTIGSISHGASWFFGGSLSNASLFNTDQSANIATIYNNGTPGDLTSLSPVSWWKLDDSATWTTSWSIPDDGSASNTGTSSGMTQGNLVPDTVTRGTAMYSEYSFEFDGVGDHFGASATGISSTITVSAWIKTSTTGIQTIVNEDQAGGAGTRNWNLLLEPGNKIQIVIINTDGSENNKLRSTALEVQDGNWHNIVFTYDGTANVDGLKTYVDGGNLEGFQTTSTGIITTDTLGVYTGGLQVTGLWPFTGNISNVAIWNSVLSAANVLAIYNNGRPANLTSLSPTVWWRMGENASWDGADWTIKDQIGSNDGTSAGNPDLVGEAPQSFSNGLSDSMDIDSRIGESGFSDENALSYNMDSEARVEDVPA